LDILLSQQNVDAIKHITDNHFSFRNKRIVCITVQLLQRSRLIQHLSENVIFVFLRFAWQYRSIRYLKWHIKATFDCLLYR